VFNEEEKARAEIDALLAKAGWQAAAWSEALGKAVQTDDWKNQLEANNAASNFLAGREFAKWLAAEHNDTRAVMSDLGLAKSP